MQAQRSHATIALALNLALALTTISCRQEPKSAADADVSPIRGERIVPTPVNAGEALDGAGSKAVVSAADPAPPTQPEAPGAATTLSPAPVTEDQPAGEPMFLGFDKLSGFTYEMPSDLLDTNQVTTAPASDKIPPAVRAFDKKAVALKGFMLPLKVEAGLVTELLILRDQSMCCYGAVPKINEWVSVKMAGKGVKPIMDQPVTLVGKLHVGEVRENGYLVGIYQMDGERIANPPGL